MARLHTILAIVVLLLVGQSLHGQEPPADVAARIAAITADFQSASDRSVTQPSAGARSALDTQYLAAVKRALAAATRSFNLEQALIWREEKNRIESNTALPKTDADTLLPALAAMRKTYRESAAKITLDQAPAAIPLFEKVDSELEALQAELTKKVLLDDALIVKAERERFAALRAKQIPATPLPAKPLTGDKSTTLPTWIEQASASGGSLRIWGFVNGVAIDERAVLKYFSSSDYVRVATGNNGFVLAARRRGNGARTILDTEAQGDHSVVEFKNLQSLDRQFDTGLADDKAFKNNGHTISNKIDPWEKPIIRGGGDSHLLRLASGEWEARGYAYTNGETIQAALKPILTSLQKDNATVLSAGPNRISWITGENRLRDISITLRPGSIRELAVSTAPAEKIIELFNGTSKAFGSWIALGEGGSVYSAATGGFAKPFPELTPALTLRTAGEISLNTIAARRPDGTWHAVGPDAELNRIVAEAGHALDLDIFIRNAKSRAVLWIEPKTAMKPRDGSQPK